LLLGGESSAASSSPDESPDASPLVARPNVANRMSAKWSSDDEPMSPAKAFGASPGKPGNSLMKVLGRKGTRKGPTSSDGGSRGDSPMPSPESSVHEGAASPSSSIGSEMEILAGRVSIAVGGKQGDNSQ